MVLSCLKIRLVVAVATAVLVLSFGKGEGGVLPAQERLLRRPELDESYETNNGGGRKLQQQQQQQGINDELSCYRTVAETFASMDALAALYPDFVTLDSIGPSYLKSIGDENGEDIRVIVLSAPSNTATPIRKANHVLVGGHHSRELPPPETLMRWAEYLLSNYDKNADVTWVLERTNIHIVPIANPDGRTIVQQHLNWYYRKNVKPSGCTDQSVVVDGVNAYDGVDLNRNYPLFWGLDTGSSGDPCSAKFRGTGPLSETESSAVYNYVRGLFPDDIKKGTVEEATAKLNETCPQETEGLFFDVHSSGDFIYFPWGFENTIAPDHRSLLTMSAKLASPGNFTLWGPEQDGFLYFVSGDATDTMYGIDCIPSFGYELGSKFYANCSELEETIVPRAHESFMLAAKAAKAPYKIALGPDILDISAIEMGENTIKFEVTVSDEDLIVPHAIFPADVSKSQSIAQVNMFVDDHPYDDSTKGMSMNAMDGAFDSVTEVATLGVALDWQTSNRHIVYFQATDSEGSVGAVSAIFVEKRRQAAGGEQSSEGGDNRTDQEEEGAGEFETLSSSNAQSVLPNAALAACTTLISIVLLLRRLFE